MSGKIMAVPHMLFIGICVLEMMPQVTSDESMFPSTDGCYKSADEETCPNMLDIYCRNIITFSIEQYGGCHIDYYEYDSRLEVIHVHFKPDLNDNNLRIDDNGYNHLIDVIDISNNELEQVLSIPEMLNLKTLNFSKNHLTQAKLSNSDRLQSLTTLDYSYNTINTIIVNGHEEIFDSLTNLNFSHNSLTVIPNSVFEPFTQMTVLDLSHNYIDLLNILTFVELKNLVHLNLSNNRITAINSSLLRFKKLEELDLSHNALTSLKSADFDKLAELRKLDLSFNSIVNVESNVFDSCNIKFMDLSNNALKFIPVNLFLGRNLTMFSIEGNGLESLSKGTFKGLTFVTKLDLGDQKLSSLENYTFSGLESLNTLLLNNNDLTYIPSLCFDSLHNLVLLDLSGNHIAKVKFSLKDLLALETLFLNNNNIDEFSPESFQAQRVTQLNISHNNLSDLSQKGFKNLNNLTSFSVRHNPIAGDLKENSFSGLHLLPTLDISGTLLVGLRNGSFRGLEHLIHLNISHCKIVEIDFNTFANTSAIKILDLSFNQLSQFIVNSVDLPNLNTILLHNNLIIKVTPSYFQNMNSLSEISLSSNKLKTIENGAFVDQLDLRSFDISNNPSLEFNTTQLKCARSLYILIIFGIKSSKLSFENFNESAITVLKILNCGVRNVSALQLRWLERLQELTLSHNHVVRLEAGAFTALADLRTLDLSHNHIAFIQPGIFKDNFKLFKLILNHNNLVAIHYGVFRGLKQINTIDLSYNNISSLTSDQLYEVDHLKVLNIDHNNITSINVEEFQHSNLAILSIGSNPLPCDDLLHMKQLMRIRITALEIVEHSAENIDGIACNMAAVPSMPSNHEDPNSKILLDIRDIFKNFIDKKTSRDDNATVIQPINNYQIESLTALREILAALKGENVLPESTTVLAPNSSLEPVVGSYSNKIHEPREPDNQPLIFLAVSMGMLLVVVSVGVVILYKQYKNSYSYMSRNPRLPSEQEFILSSVS